MRFKFPAVVLFFTFIFVSCSTIPDPPPGKPFNYTVPREISDINLPVELKAVSLQNLMNKVFNGTLYQGTILVNGFKIVVKKRSNMLITANDGFLHVNLPEIRAFSNRHMPFSISREQALEDAETFRYLIVNSYSGREYAESKWIDFENIFLRIKRERDHWPRRRR